ncbi:MAG TPA: CBS domain-containing protein [Arenimonas sp.]|nr:CBS domain-containing protein [Arenimonas sp.]
MDAMARLRVGNVMSTPAHTVDVDQSLESVHALFERLRIRHAPVTEHGKLVGVISDRDLLRHLSPFLGTLSERQQDLGTLRKHVHQAMTRNPVTIANDAPLAEALDALLLHRISCLPVLDLRGNLVGILTLRGVLSAVAQHLAGGD